ncbi:hypothetical protein B0H19DRAFT_1253044 [Mycena capillaripes]|nr:hypothetical protein B0H19DRAFT_1253044 [Mycena capillaripes]
MSQVEENEFKLRLASSIYESREAESRLVRSLLAAAHAAVNRHQGEVKLARLRQVEAHASVSRFQEESNVASLREAESRAVLDCHQAEIELAVLREVEAQSRLQYYLRLDEIAKKNLSDARLQVGVVRHDIWVEDEATFAAEQGEDNQVYGASSPLSTQTTV